MGEYVEAVTIIVIVCLNSLPGFFSGVPDGARAGFAARHGGARTEIPAALLVPDDIVLLEAGCRVPAGGIVTECHCVAADESPLTGASLPAEKRARLAGCRKEGPSLPDMAYMGTVITAGRGVIEVTATGPRTQMGGIAGLLDEISEGPTPLQQRLSSMSRYIAAGCLAICGAVPLTGILRGEAPFDMFLTWLLLYVAAIPEGLAAVITISLGPAVSRMLARHALIRRLHTVETLGCADVICSDKTGTLT